MTIHTGILRKGLSICVLLLAFDLAACSTDDTPESAATGPGVENPAGVPNNSVQPSLGGAGNGGGYSGGGAGAGGIGQGAR